MHMRRGGHLGMPVLTGLALCAGLGVAGCADLGRATGLGPDPIDVRSPVAAQVRAVDQADFAYPRFRDVPPVPTDVRPPEAWRASVARSVQARDELTAWAAANPPMLTGADTERFAEAQRATIPANERLAAPADLAGTEAFAARLRALATPPPPPE
jgi:hypothetical protein